MGALTQKTVLVTGAAKRVGSAIVRAAHAEGANVAVHYRNSRAAVDALCVELNSARANSARAFGADLLDTSVFSKLIDDVIAAFGCLDVLVNNASTFYPTPVGTATETQWRDLMGANAKAPFFLSQAAAPALKKSHGLIVNMVDIHGTRPLIAHPIYSMAKAALVMMTKSLARELGPEVRVNGIAPGPVMWPEAGMAQSLKDEIVSRTALKRSGSPDDIARAALYFMKDAPFVTGQILAIDGGRSIGW